LEADENIEALKHYYGITQQGELVVRGIEIRRHDIPNFIKQFQTKLLGQDIEKYKNLFPHVSAAIQLLSSKGGEGRRPSKGDTMQYIYINSKHKNPLRIVVPLEIL
jgi:DNA polymerase elongation subunit (family B)